MTEFIRSDLISRVWTVGGAGAAVGVGGLVGLKCAAYTQDLSKTHFRLPQLSVGDTDKQTNTQRRTRNPSTYLFISRHIRSTSTKKRKRKRRKKRVKGVGGGQGSGGPRLATYAQYGSNNEMLFKLCQQLLLVFLLCCVSSPFFAFFALPLLIDSIRN